MESKNWGTPFDTVEKTDGFFGRKEHLEPPRNEDVFAK